MTKVRYYHILGESRNTTIAFGLYFYNMYDSKYVWGFIVKNTNLVMLIDTSFHTFIHIDT